MSHVSITLKTTMMHENCSIVLYFSFDGVTGFDQVAIPDSNFSHKHAKMATYKGDPIVVGSCWGLEVEQLKTSQEMIAWNQLESFPNPEKCLLDSIMILELRGCSR